MKYDISEYPLTSTGKWGGYKVIPHDDTDAKQGRLYVASDGRKPSEIKPDANKLLDTINSTLSKLLK